MATYLPDTAGRWVAAVRGGVVLVTPSVEAERVAALWPRLLEDDPTSHVLDALTADGLAATPPFALVVRNTEGSARVVARGGVAVHVGETTVSGTGVSTWAERVIEVGDAQVRVRVDGAATDAAVPLPVTEAVVHAVAVHSGAIEPVEAVAAVAPVEEQTRVVSAPARATAPVEAPAPAAVTPPAAAPPTITVPPIAVPPPAASSVVPAEQTMVPAEDTIAGPSTPPASPSLDASRLVGDHDGDHDGLTVASIDLRRLRAERAARTVEAAPAAGVPGPPAPTSSLRMPDGSMEPIGTEVVLGRSPSVSQVSGGRLPRLVTIGAGDPDISRNHLRVAIEGDTVVVTDLHSRNGTHVVAPGKPPVKLRAGEPTPVLAGTVVDLGGGWTIQVVGA